MKEKKIAIVCDWLIDFGGAELVISHLLELYPNADIYTSVCYMDHPMLAGRGVYTSWLQKVPFFNKRHKLAGILRPFAFRSFDLSEYDIIISSSSAEAKNAGYTKKKAGAIHFCYCHTSTRYYWSHAKEYENMMEFGVLNPLVKALFRIVKRWMQRVDYRAAQKVDSFIANSNTTKDRIQKYYHRESTVIYPGVNPASLSERVEKGDEYYISVGRCIPYKKFNLLVDTFNKNGKKLILCTATDTPLFRELKVRSKKNIEWKFRISHEEKNALMAGARAFIFPPEEDFGLVPIEAMILGTPVIAYGKGGATETVVDGQTGLFFSSQTPEALDEAIVRFEKMHFDRVNIQKHAGQFSKIQFQKNISKFIQEYD